MMMPFLPIRTMTVEIIGSCDDVIAWMTRTTIQTGDTRCTCWQIFTVWASITFNQEKRVNENVVLHLRQRTFGTTARRLISQTETTMMASRTSGWTVVNRTVASRPARSTNLLARDRMARIRTGAIIVRNALNRALFSVERWPTERFHRNNHSKWTRWRKTKERLGDKLNVLIDIRSILR